MARKSEDRRASFGRLIRGLAARFHQLAAGSAGRPIVFLHPGGSPIGTTYLRNTQLCELAKARFAGSRSIKSSSNMKIRDAIVIISKASLLSCSDDELSRLSRSNTLIADPVDGMIAEERLATMDGLMAASFAAFDDYSVRFPGKRIFHVTHHVDLRVPDTIRPASDALRPIFVGNPPNAILTPPIPDRVEIYRAVSSDKANLWIRRLQDYNFHYAVRRDRPDESHKPFVKGFLAAHCRSNMLIQRGSGDSARYLGDDYPYLLPEAPSIEAILEALDFAAESLGGPEWRRGLEVMEDVRRRSTREHVMAEFEAMIREL